MAVLVRYLIALAIANAWQAQSFADAPDPPLPAPEPIPPPVPEPAPAPEPALAPASTEVPQTAESVASAPRPEAAHQRSRDPERRGEWLRWIPRVVLFPVRVAVFLIGWPISNGLYVLELYNLSSRVKSVFFNEDGTIGIFPVGFAETGFGLNAGARVVVRRLGGTDAGLTARASFGGRFRQLFSTKLSTNRTFARAALELRGSYEVRPKDQFFGIGNGEVIDGMPMMAVDARGGELHASRFRQDAVRVSLATTYYPPVRNLSLAVSGAFNHRTFAAAEEDVSMAEQIGTNFDLATVNRFVEGTSTMYGELELTYDTRRAPNRWESAATPSAGWFLQGFAGYTLGLSDDPASYVRYGVDLQRYLRLAEGPRALAFRLYLEGVTGGYREVSFYDLPRLGGPLLLRGYQVDQFRDRFAGMTTAEYQFDANKLVGGFVFVDLGRVFSQPADLELADLRVGFGAGIQIHTQKSFLGRFTVASSTDGGLFFNLSFDPVYDTRARVERR